MGSEAMIVGLPENETCDECGFDASRWSRQDAIRTVQHAADLVESAVEGLAPDDWNQRSRPDMWSIAEYVDHVTEIIEINRAGCELAIAEPGRDIWVPDAQPFPPEPAGHDPTAVIDALRAQADVAARFFLGLRDDDWDRRLSLDHLRWTIAWDLTHICHDLFHHLTDIATIRRELGDTIGPLAGAVAQVNASDGGVPKRSVEWGHVGFGGLDGDRQATRRHHGRPWQAICLYSADVIEALRAEGHPIESGSTGENLTLSGIDWAQLRAGLVIEIGEIRLRLSAPAVPCAKNRPFFAEGDVKRMDHDRHPGWSRWYASVLQPGDIATGDEVVISSD
ncbi:MAG: MOSC domain-containing protein [Actinomycetota bacterium]